MYNYKILKFRERFCRVSFLLKYHITKYSYEDISRKTFISRFYADFITQK